MNKLYFMRVVEKTQGLFTSSPHPRGKLRIQWGADMTSGELSRVVVAAPSVCSCLGLTGMLPEILILLVAMSTLSVVL